MKSIGANDVVALIGLGTLGAGLWMISIPIALIVVGALLFLLAIGSAFLRGRK